ncbi:MAG: pseudouridine-5'-phosphate glycosidase [Pyrinomonadaceae bacterium]
MNGEQFNFNEEVAAALAENRPVVALESTVIAHGLPRPDNLKFAVEVEQIVRDAGATPATIAVLEGVPHIGLNSEQIEFLANGDNISKLSRRDLPIALAKKLNGATTVATTAFFADRAGIRVFATGGIGGIHRGNQYDVSADLPELASTPITIVCAGAKSILNLPATREWLETNGVCIVGWKTDEFPAFYSRTSNLKTDARAETAIEVAKIIAARDALKLKNAILLAVPVPVEFEIPPETAENFLAQALREAAQQNITGKEMTPFLLRRMAEQSGGATLRANLALLKQNARVAAQIAQTLILN